jgi:hypothetical protein
MTARILATRWAGAAVMTAMHAEALRAMHAEARETLSRRRRARWTSLLKVLGVVLLLAAIAS